MAKIRVRELANELDIQSKVIIQFLEEKNITGKVASSSIEDDIISMVRKRFSSDKSRPSAKDTDSKESSAKSQNRETSVKVSAKEPAQNENKGESAKTMREREEGKGETVSVKVPERPRKKSSITSVYNPQNSKTAKKRPVRVPGDRPAKPQGED